MDTVRTPFFEQELELVDFLEDWRGDDHRPLAEGSRREVGRYIEAIVAHDPLLKLVPNGARRHACALLWHTFRDFYDDLRGPFMHSASEDVGRAMSRL